MAGSSSRAPVNYPQRITEEICRVVHEWRRRRRLGDLDLLEDARDDGVAALLEPSRG